MALERQAIYRLQREQPNECRTFLFAVIKDRRHSSSISLMFFSLLRSHDSFLIFLGLGPRDCSSVVSPGSLSSDDINSTALGDDKVSLALALSPSERAVVFSRLERRLESF